VSLRLEIAAWLPAAQGPLAVNGGPLGIGQNDNAARRSCPISFLRNVGSNYSE